MIRPQYDNSPSTMDPGVRMPLGEMLVMRGLLTRDQLKQALEYQAQKGHKKLLGEILIELNFLNEPQVLEALAESYGVPFATQTARIADPKVAELLPRDFVEDHKVLPLFLV